MTDPQQQLEHVETMAAAFEDTTEKEPPIRSFPLIAIAIEEVLKGTPAKHIRERFAQEGYECGMTRTFSLIKLAKKEIAKEGYADFKTNYIWAQTNLLEVHARAVAAGDDKMRVVVIKQLIDLWGLLNPPDDGKQQEITPEMIEEFESKLLR